MTGTNIRPLSQMNLLSAHLINKHCLLPNGGSNRMFPRRLVVNKLQMRVSQSVGKDYPVITLHSKYSVWCAGGWDETSRHPGILHPGAGCFV